MPHGEVSEIIAAPASAVFDLLHDYARRLEWEVERSKLTALQEAGLPAASKYDPAPIDRRIAEAAKAEDAARVRARELGGSARAAYDAWRSVHEQYEARARSIPTG